MSTNCICCIKNKRTSYDLLCDDCRPIVMRERALGLLKTHNGSCCVPAESGLGKAFAELEKEGELTITQGGGFLPGYITVHSKDFKPKIISNGDEQ